MEWRERDGVRWLEAELGAARAAFSTRLGGVSAAPFESLNVGVLTADADGNVVENRRRLAAALGRDPAGIAFGPQVHGDAIATHAGSADPTRFLEPGSELPAVDGHVTADAAISPLVFAADCLPVALSGPGGVAMLHCGWRGLAAGIVARGAEAVAATDAAIGPAIGPCCFEVGAEVLQALPAADGPQSGRIGDLQARRHVDLGEVARRLLRAAGVERIESAAMCTSCEAELFFSYRRDGETGRQAGLVWIESEGV